MKEQQKSGINMGQVTMETKGSNERVSGNVPHLPSRYEEGGESARAPTGGQSADSCRTPPLHHSCQDAFSAKPAAVTTIMTEHHGTRQRLPLEAQNSPNVNISNNEDSIKQPFVEEEEATTGGTGDGSSTGRLRHFNDMPSYLQFNPYIITGYREMLTTKDSFRSLLYFHNETVNILTHGVPIIYILYTVPPLIPWNKISSRFLPLCHIVGSLCPWVGSFTYHLFMNHKTGGEKLYHRLLQLDMLGIWVSQSFGAMPMVCSTVFCFPWPLRFFLIASYCLLSIWGLYKALRAWSPWERRLCFALPFIMRLILACLRAVGIGGGEPSALANVFMQDFVSLVGGVVGALHIPEKWFPGHFDLWLNSHNIMHVLVVLAVYFMHHATIADLVWMSNVQCHAQL